MKTLKKILLLNLVVCALLVHGTSFSNGERHHINTEKHSDTHIDSVTSNYGKQDGTVVHVVESNHYKTEDTAGKSKGTVEHDFDGNPVRQVPSWAREHLEANQELGIPKDQHYPKP